MNPASNLFLVGPMGAGKSTIGRRLAGHFGLAFFDLDQEIETRTGATVALIFELEGEPGFRERESSVLAELAAGEGRLVATGGGTVLRDANRELLRRRGFVVYLRASLAQQLARLARDRKRPLLQGPDKRQRLEALAREREPLYAEVADYEVNGADMSPDQAARRIAGALEQQWQRLPAVHSVA
ncbi:MAG TPA: shikimate kinase AroK [Xanthomonadales bacterium]|nr:shikimate kinase AroK [Xanthomonadales bacterium]